MKPTYRERVLAVYPDARIQSRQNGVWVQYRVVRGGWPEVPIDEDWTACTDYRTGEEIAWKWAAAKLGKRKKP